MKIKLILIAVNIFILANFIDHSKLESFVESSSEVVEENFQEKGAEINKYAEFSKAFRNRFHHSIENFKENFGLDD